MDKLIDEIMGRIFVELEASGRHVHLTEDAAMTLFGHLLTAKRPLSQPGQFVCNERVTVIGEKGRFENVAVLGPERKECQVELSVTDCVTLGVRAPVRQSGDTKDTPGITLQANGKEIRLNSGLIVAQRHIHMTPEDAAKRKIKDGQKVKLRALTARPVIFEDVIVRVSDKFRTYVHLDYDEANACGFCKGDLGMIL